jgi:hypothetical protein
MPAPPAAGRSAKKTVFASGDDLEDDFTAPETAPKEINWGSDDEATGQDVGREDDNANDSDQEKEIVNEVLGESKNVKRKRHSVGGESKKRRTSDSDVVVPQSAPPKLIKKKVKSVTF